MTDACARAAHTGGLGLLERAINFTLGSLHVVTPGALSDATPCPAWDLRALLAHLDDSLTALHEAVDAGHVDLDPSEREEAFGAAPTATVRRHAIRLVGACIHADPDREVVSVAGTPLSACVVATTGAIEVAVHGWDIAQACGWRRPLPPSLAEELLDLSALFVEPADRPRLFAPPVPVPPQTSPGDRLLAFLGRRPLSPGVWRLVHTA